MTGRFGRLARGVLRGRPVPPAVAAVPLGGDRRLDWALTADGAPVVAAAGVLHLPGAGPVPWERVEHAGWRPPVLVVREVAEVAGTGREHRLTLDLADGRSDLPAVVEARVRASVAWSSRQRLDPSGAVQLVARRRPGRLELDWQLVFAAAEEAADPARRAQAEQHLAAARRAIG